MTCKTLILCTLLIPAAAALMFLAAVFIPVGY